MGVTVLFSPGLRGFCENKSTIELDAQTVGEALQKIIGRFSSLHRRLFTEDGKRNRFINVYVNEEDIRYLNDVNTPLKDGDQLDIFGGVSGG